MFNHCDVVECNSWVLIQCDNTTQDHEIEIGQKWAHDKLIACTTDMC